MSAKYLQKKNEIVKYKSSTEIIAILQQGSFQTRHYIFDTVNWTIK